MNFSLPKFELPEISLPSVPSLPIPTALPDVGRNLKEQLDQEYTQKVGEASQTVNAGLQQTLNSAVENAKTGLVAAGDAIIKSFYERALSLVFIFVGCLVGLLLLAFVTKLIRDWLRKQKESVGNPPKTV